MNVNREIAAYEKLQRELEANHMGKWVLIHEEKLVAVFESFEDAAAQAVEKFGRGPYVIRQVGASPVVLPASVMYRMA